MGGQRRGESAQQPSLVSGPCWPPAVSLPLGGATRSNPSRACMELEQHATTKVWPRQCRFVGNGGLLGAQADGDVLLEQKSRSETGEH